MTVPSDGIEQTGPAPLDPTPTVSPSAPVDPGPVPAVAPPGLSEADAPPRAAARDGGWAATASQGLLLARWVAAELVAQRIEGLAMIAWIVGGLGLVCIGLSFPVDPGWPLVALGGVLVLLAVIGRLVIAVAAGIVRRLALPRRARHLRQESVAARGRLLDAVAQAGVPVSAGAALRFLRALARGRRPHAGVAGELGQLTHHLAGMAEVDRLRASLAQAAPAPSWLSRRSSGPGR